LKSLPVGQENTRGITRFILAGAVESEVDGAGRILIPEYLKEFAKLEQRVCSPVSQTGSRSGTKSSGRVQEEDREGAEGMAQTAGTGWACSRSFEIFMIDIQTLTSVRAKPRLRREEGEALHERKSGPLSTTHISVMVKEAIQLLDLKKGEVVVDATLGMGGHSEAILKEAAGQLYSFDADAEAVAAGPKSASSATASRVALINANFAISKSAQKGVTENQQSTL
jgi:hypothetical protein